MSRPIAKSLFKSVPIRPLHTSSPLPPPGTVLPPSQAGGISHLPKLLPATAPSPLPASTPAALAYIKAQSTPTTGRYIVARLHSRNYLLHPQDILTLPTLRPLQPPGTLLNLSNIIEVGSRDYAIQSPAAQAKELRRGMDWKQKKTAELPAIPAGVATCELTVLEHTKSPIESLLKKKRRKGYQKTVKNKQGWTRLRVGDIHLAELPDVVQGEGLDGLKV